MKGLKLIRPVLMLVALCVGLWQAPTIIEQVERIQGGATIDPDQLSTDVNSAALTLEYGNRSAGNRDLVIFTPDDMDDAERARLLEEAHRIRRGQPDQPAPKRASSAN